MDLSLSDVISAFTLSDVSFSFRRFDWVMGRNLNWAFILLNQIPIIRDVNITCPLTDYVGKFVEQCSLVNE